MKNYKGNGNQNSQRSLQNSETTNVGMDVKIRKHTATANVSWYNH